MSARKPMLIVHPNAERWKNIVASHHNIAAKSGETSLKFNLQSSFVPDERALVIYTQY